MDRLRLFQTVTVSPPRGQRLARDFQAYVVAVDGRMAALHPVRRMDVLWLPRELNGVLLAFRHGERPVGLTGSLRYRGGFEDIRFQVTDSVFIPPKRSSRLRVCTPVTMTPVDPQGRRLGEPLDHQTRDVGPDGLTLEDASGLMLGTRLRVELNLPQETEPVRGMAVLKTEPGDGPPAACFVELPPWERSRLRQFVVTELRHRLKMLHSLEEEVDVWSSAV